ncbi:MAG TPA: alpha/beta fold hydrolase [Streptosporangiaceae bacterium]|jgi:polyhydroxyalkanoate synthase
MSEAGAQAEAQAAAESAAEAAGALDLLLSDAALGVVRLFRPDTSVLRFAARLARKPKLTGGTAALVGMELGKILAGRSAVTPDRRDRRFADPAWASNPLLKRIMQAYLVAGQGAEGLLAGAELDWRDGERMTFLVSNLIAAAAPSNNPVLNPVGWKAAIDSGGSSAVRGVRAMVSDLSAAPRVPSMVEPGAFEVGGDLAVTPGEVVHRTEVFELIQYQPVTPTVHKYPLVIVPPMINKFYITDLAPGRSMIEYLVGQGHQVFAVSWRNPDARHAGWNLDTYGGAIVTALDTACDITRAPKASICALCSGGIASSMVAAHLNESGRADRLVSLCLGVTVLDQSRAGTPAALVDETTATAAKAASRARGYLDGRALAEIFAWLRPGDLVWNYWVNNYLEGRKPRPFDILYWNADTTRLPAALHADFIDLGLANALTHPGQATMLGSPVDLSKTDVNAYVVAGVSDHLCPWQSCYRSARLLGGEVRFVLSTSGHIASMVNPPGNPKATFQAVPDERAEPGLPADPSQWQAAARPVSGSWWPDYSAWLAERSGGERNRPAKLGRGSFVPLGAAPGTYVLDR